ncbi:hypothetical protein MS3_00000378 [Schistosoma haematobium]|uniref:Uncharacterized protein n=1 Tax=Schistosoma haematobium TaxID=6185 RepID=A0A922ILM2_SCHHA|nr:hypothetical protein MS3_00000378 [Schistosoma haematobium]KAH9582536.1 hypothetical protein MS3_00000378 [Schistosoma haematobium]
MSNPLTLSGHGTGSSIKGAPGDEDDWQSKSSISTIEEHLRLKTTDNQQQSHNFQYSSSVWGENLDNCENHHPDDTSVYQQLSTKNTSDPLARHYQQQRTMQENKSDVSGGRNEEEAMEVDRTHIEESPELRHKTSPSLESS